MLCCKTFFLLLHLPWQPPQIARSLFVDTFSRSPLGPLPPLPRPFFLNPALPLCPPRLRRRCSQPPAGWGVQGTNARTNHLASSRRKQSKHLSRDFGRQTGQHHWIVCTWQEASDCCWYVRRHQTQPLSHRHSCYINVHDGVSPSASSRPRCSKVLLLLFVLT